MLAKRATLSRPDARLLELRQAIEGLFRLLRLDMRARLPARSLGLPSSHHHRPSGNPSRFICTAFVIAKQLAVF